MVEYPAMQIPDVSIQRQEILEKLKEPMELEAIWYIIDCKWFKCFKYFVGIEDNDRSTVNNPGPIDNSLLIDWQKNDLKTGLVENLDYVPIPSSAWSLLLGWYGLKEQQSPFPRKVINVANPPNVDLKLEVYMVELSLYDSPQLATAVVHSFSKADTIGKIEEFCRKEFGVSDDQKVQLRCFYGPIQSQVLSNPLSNVHQESLHKDLKILMEIIKPDETPPPKNCVQPAVASSSKAQDSPKIPRVVAPNNNRFNHIMLTRQTANQAYSLLGTAEGRGPPCEPGRSGLMNLGNTCFLNSIIQCLSNCMPITQYFLASNHRQEINRSNPLGTSGAIANSFGDVISMMWSGKHVITVPHNFKIQLTHFAPQFAGFQQHDAQELLTFLLDGLHEDLNRIKDKPYQQEDDSDLEDEALAQASWEYFLRRNDSIIIDHFHGMLKSRVVCPDCEKVSIKFDTFSTLSLPLPERCDRKMTVRFIPYDQFKKVVDLTITVPKRGLVGDMVNELSKITEVKPAHILMAEISKCHFHRFFCLDDPIDKIDDRDTIVMYDLPAELLEDSSVNYTVVPVVLSHLSEPSRHFLSTLFGMPFVILLPRGLMSYDSLYEVVCKQLSRSFEGLGLANNNHGSVSMDYENSDGSQNGAGVTHMFTLSKVSTFAYEQSLIVREGESEMVEIPEYFGRYFLSVQIKKQVGVELYTEPRVEAEDHTNGFHPMVRPTLENCLALFTTTEKLGENNAWYCPQCDKMQRATKKLDMWKMPNILIFHLKRFAFNEVQRAKLVTKVEFPLEGLDINHYVLSKHKENLIYDLIGVCNHYGSLMGGHYTAFCKNQEDGQWYCFDDNTVTPVPAESVQTENAYLLFYQRRPVPRTDPDEEKVDL